MPALRTPALVAAAFALVPLACHAQATAQGLESIKAEATTRRGQVNAELDRYQAIHDRAKRVVAEIPGGHRDKRLKVPGVNRKLVRLEDDELLQFLPRGLVDDLNRRVFQEYDRGFYDWRAGQYPPYAYASHSVDSMRWTRNLFDRWREDVYFNWSIPASVYSLYIRRKGTGGGTEASLERLLEGLPTRRQAAEAAVTSGLEYRADTSRSGWWIFSDVDWKNEAEWNGLSEAANSALASYDRDLDAAATSLDGVVRAWVAQAVQYDGGSRPLLRFLPGYRPGQAGTGDGYSSRPAPGLFGATPWHYYFDYQVLEALPPALRGEVVDRFVQAYFRGARDAKYSRGSGGYQAGTGDGYSFPSSYGTGDGYGYGSESRYQGTGGASARDGRAWDTGTGTGSGTSSGSGSGSGTGSGSSGTGSGNTGGGTGGQVPGFEDIFGGTGSGTGTGS